MVAVSQQTDKAAAQAAQQHWAVLITLVVQPVSQESSSGRGVVETNFIKNGII